MTKNCSNRKHNNLGLVSKPASCELLAIVFNTIGSISHLENTNRHDDSLSTLIYFLYDLVNISLEITEYDSDEWHTLINAHRFVRERIECKDSNIQSN